MAWFTRVQEGVISSEQLGRCGLSESDVAYRVRTHRLHRHLPRVYAVGHPSLTVRGRRIAALLYGGPHAVLSHVDAAQIHGLLPAVDYARVHITTPTQRRSNSKVHAHTSAAVEVTRRLELPVTTVARTILDMADLRDQREIERMLDQAHIKRVLDLDELERTVHTHPGRRTATLARALEFHRTAVTLTLSELEEAFLVLVREASLPLPLVNQRLHGYTADFLWPAQRLIVETDGLAAHTTPRAFARDRRRDRVHRAAGYRVERVTWWDVTRDARRLVAELRAWLAALPS